MHPMYIALPKLNKLFPYEVENSRYDIKGSETSVYQLHLRSLNRTRTSPLLGKELEAYGAPFLHLYLPTYLPTYIRHAFR